MLFSHSFLVIPAGNLTSSCIKEAGVDVYTHYKYNPQNKLAQIVKEDSGGDIIYEFIYDSQNTRIGLVKNGEKRYDIHDGMRNPIGSDPIIICKYLYIIMIK